MFKFKENYILTNNNKYAFCCFHDESSYNGSFGRYLCVSDNAVLSNGSNLDSNIYWTIQFC